MKIITTIFYLLYIISYLNIFISNPGIVGREYLANIFKFKNEEDKLNYQIWKTLPIFFRVFHWEKCNICVIKYDHLHHILVQKQR